MEKPPSTSLENANKDASVIPISKNKFRKLRNYQKRLQNRAIKREEERRTQKEQNPLRRRRPHEDEKLKTQEKLIKAQQIGAQVVIDCQYNDQMSEKEQRRFAQQLRRVYSSNKAASDPLHLYFTNLCPTGEFYKVCTQVNDGFEKYLVERTDRSILEAFSDQLGKLVYLSPDAPLPLDFFDPSKIYIVGGLVDETTRSNVTASFTQSKSIPSARLPIQEYFERGEQGTYKTVLTVNQIVDIILKWYETKDWIKAIQVGLPQRTGFIPKCLSQRASEGATSPGSSSVVRTNKAWLIKFSQKRVNFSKFYLYKKNKDYSSLIRLRNGNVHFLKKKLRFPEAEFTRKFRKIDSFNKFLLGRIWWCVVRIKSLKLSFHYNTLHPIILLRLDKICDLDAVRIKKFPDEVFHCMLSCQEMSSYGDWEWIVPIGIDMGQGGSILKEVRDTLGVVSVGGKNQGRVPINICFIHASSLTKEVINHSQMSGEWEHTLWLG